MKVLLNSLQEFNKATRLIKEDNAFQHHMGWLKALEQAQWQQRFQLSNQAKSSGAEADSIKLADKLKNELNQTEPATQPIELPHMNKAQQTILNTIAGIVGNDRNVISKQPLSETALVSGAANSSTTLRETHIAFTNKESQSAPVTAKPAADMKWESTNMHFSVRDDKLSVWIRDANLSESAGAKLLHDLRAKFRAWGFELASLSINGHPVDPIPAHRNN